MDKSTIDLSVRLSRRRMDRTARCWAVAHKVVLSLSLALVCQSAMAQAMYRIKSLGVLSGCSLFPLVAAGLNDAGEVAGVACNEHPRGDIPRRAFLWKNDGTPMVDLSPPGGGADSGATALSASGLVTGFAQDITGWFAFVSSGDGTPMTRIYDSLGGNQIFPSAINDLGQLTGRAYTSVGTAAVTHAFVWKNNGSPVLDLGTFGGDSSYASGINASGQVTGGAYLAGNAASHAFLWRNDGTPILDLGTLGGNSSGAHAINASGQIAGGSSTVPGTNNGAHAFFWANNGTPMQDLGTLGGAQSSAVDLNDAGQVAGWSNTRGANHWHAFVWMNDGTPMKDLGTIGGTASLPNDMNSSGQVTGKATLAGDVVSHAFLWRNDGTKIQDLNKLIDPTDPQRLYVTLTNGDFINDRGDIVAEGTGTHSAVPHLYLLEGTVLTVAPRALAFGNHPINTSSAAMSVTLTNTSAKVVTINSIALTGTAAGQFASTNNCGRSLVGHATCTIKVTFRPTAKGAKHAYLNVNGWSNGGDMRSVKLTGTGT